MLSRGGGENDNVINVDKTRTVCQRNKRLENSFHQVLEKARGIGEAHGLVETVIHMFVATVLSDKREALACCHGRGQTTSAQTTTEMGSLSSTSFAKSLTRLRRELHRDTVQREYGGREDCGTRADRIPNERAPPQPCNRQPVATPAFPLQATASACSRQRQSDTARDSGATQRNATQRVRDVM